MIAHSRLYFVCGSLPAGGDPQGWLRGAIAGGVDAIQLREKDPRDDEAIIAAAVPFRLAASDAGIPFILNDRPDLVQACGADGVHVGQADEPVARARELAGPEAIIGLSTHNPQQMAAADEASGGDRPDYISVGPIWETPTKPGRPAAGLDYVRQAARECELPWFAIGGIAPGNVAEVVAAGATRIAIVRAISEAADPGAAAHALRTALDQSP